MAIIVLAYGQVLINADVIRDDALESLSLEIIRNCASMRVSTTLNTSLSHLLAGISKAIILIDHIHILGDSSCQNRHNLSIFHDQA